ncbi:hypothetical protein AMAG_17674 [Allomyces macrogynus ATCC 38327]|uniref:Small RNA 2'-O-methyltransferase n=1 Tax=Allomyces macrogynus (strain ATCC 38327) TaxID=578462 RepID=A0A0L0RW10_ALLM3|nr:hypothetical protein AMAG_17674 [Allomyces macrogynus ATCC 38327]|eukprot:KNE54483.1 hypothetical protein AMAG_17674 [Allomyces macrogynus ATCC 38327]
MPMPSIGCGSRIKRSTDNFRCNTASLACFLANSCLVSRITGIDVDKSALDDADRVLSPQPNDFDRLLERPLAMDLIHGSILDHHPELHGVDAIVLSEVNEHLDPPDLEQLPEALFAMCAPKLVIVSTPNVEFNVHFPDWRPGVMRDADHRFEWTLAEFESCCTMQAMLAKAFWDTPPTPRHGDWDNDVEGDAGR